MAVSIPKWFDWNAYLNNKLATMPSGTTMSSLVSAMDKAGFVGEEGSYRHFLQFGHGEDVSPSAGFDASQYYTFKAAQYYNKAVTAVTAAESATVAQLIKDAGMDAWTHSQKYGTSEMISTSNSFDTAAYLQDKAAAMGGTWTAATVATAIQKAGMNAYEHYMQYKGTGGGEVSATATYVVDSSKQASNSGQTFTLTTGADNIVGTSGDDTVGGVNAAGVAPQFSLVDTIDGGAGVDTLKLDLNVAYTGGVSIKNIEKLVSTQGGADFAATGIAGLTDVEVIVATDSYSNLGNVVNMAVTGITSGGTNNTFTFTDAAIAGAADAATLTLNNVATSAAAGATHTVNINSTNLTTGNTGLETLTVDLAGLAGNSATGGSVTIASTTTQSLKTLNVTGASNGILALAANPAASITTIDASAAKGNVSVAGIGATDTTVTGGAGNDAFAFGVNFTTADVVDGGAGTDTLGANAAQLAAITTVNANVKNIETIRVQDDIAADAVINLTNFGAKNVRIAAQTVAATVSDDLTINNLATNANIRLDGQTVAAGGSLTLNVKDASVPGTADDVTLDLRGGAVTYTATMNGVETVTVNLSNATGLANLALTDTGMTTFKVVNTGAQNFTNTGAGGVALAGTVSSVDLSGVTGTGTNTIQMTAAAGTGVSVTGSANVDTLILTNNVDVVTAGAGNDQITGLNGGDRINVGTGTDNVIYTAAAETFAGVVTSGTTVLTGVDVITGMGTSDTLTVFAAASITAATAISTSLLAGPGAVDTIALVKGSYNTDSGIFTTSTTGTDTLVQWDSNGSGAGGNLENVVLVGFDGTNSTVGTNLITLG